jgi:myo-inositol catabolism protein IolC
MTDSTPARTGPPSAAQPLFILAMDHRDSFGRTLFRVHGTPTAGQLADMRSAKELIFAGARQAAENTAGPGQLGILVDEQLGPDVARQARKAGFELAMPVEASGAEPLTFEYGDDFAEHVEAFDPDWIKVLVRFNPADPAELRDAQTQTLRRLHDWATASRRRWLIELLVPPTREQLAACDDQALHDETERQALTAQVIASLTAAGVHPGIWKLEGYETTAGARLVLDAVRDSGAPVSSRIVLGRNAPQRQVDHWLTIAAPLPGYVGFAIGRSIWNQPVADYLAGHADRDTTEARIAERYGHFIQQYLTADTAPAGDTGERSAEVDALRTGQ